LDRGIDLQDDAEHALAANRLLGGRDGRFPSDRQGQHDAGKQHGLTYRQQDHAVGRERHLTAALIDRFLLSLVRHGACPPISTLLRQAQQKAAVYERRAAHFPPCVRESNSALKATMRYFHAMNHRAARGRRQPLHSGDEQRISLDRDLDILRFDAGERRNDRQLPLALEYVDWRLPVRRRCAREARPEELTMQLLRPLDHRAGFGPHPASRVGCGHRTCLLHRINVLDIRPHSSKFWPRGRMRRSAHVVVKRRGGGAATRRPAVTRFARANESVLPLAGFRTRSTAMPRYYFHITNG